MNTDGVGVGVVCAVLGGVVGYMIARSSQGHRDAGATAEDSEDGGSTTPHRPQRTLETTLPSLLSKTAEIAVTYLQALDHRRVEPSADAMIALRQLDTTLSSTARSPLQVIAELGRVGGAAAHGCSGGRCEIR